MNRRISVLAMFIAAVVALTADFSFGQDRAAMRKASLPNARIQAELESRNKSTLVDDVPFVYGSIGRRTTWDLAKTGRITEFHSDVCYVDELSPNGTSANYYWRKESKLGLFWAFAKQPNSAGKYDILVSSDDSNYQLATSDGEKADRVPAAP